MEKEREKEDLGNEVWQHNQTWQREPSSVRNQRRREEVIQDRLRSRGKKKIEKKMKVKVMKKE